MSTQKPFCSICSQFRELPLHLHELAIFCEILNEEKVVHKQVKRKVEKCGTAKTTSIAKWLRLASQLESVEMNTFKYEMAHIYCEPVADELNSNAKHDSSIATQITRFMFISNALEEAYRLSSHIYEEEYSKLLTSGSKLERQRSYSTQATWLLDEVFTSLDMPENYFHKVTGVIELSKLYRDKFKVSFDMDFDEDKIISRGFSVIRNMRNQIAHANFPILENPEFTGDFDDPRVKRLVLTLLLRASRLAAMNIQVILSFSRKEFRSDSYYYFSEDPDTGEEFKKIFKAGKYLNHLHIKQSFGLNECSHWEWRKDMLED
ncbi:hypothetical protein SAMN06297280_3518 [Arsukibacterium tuosuense]|uniref:Uncharacterized protein n=1 Tax=Arsukibacterium tuosuense TaxID=1323745 RepID=A0A285JF77_9GAMM|nr:hypothetical protein [Arsukibacterium tuosuense]SNY58922.1 hypothetical protein SAMN06297280_3518 [Arsukibacterium tuosuense]